MIPWMLETHPEEEVIFFNHWISHSLKEEMIFKPDSPTDVQLTLSPQEKKWVAEKGFLGSWLAYSFGSLTNPFNMAYQGASAGMAWKLGVYGTFRTALAVEFFWGALILGFASTLADPQHLYTPPGYSPINLWYERQVVNPSRPNPMSLAFRRQLGKLTG